VRVRLPPRAPLFSSERLFFTDKSDKLFPIPNLTSRAADDDREISEVDKLVESGETVRKGRRYNR
jgi:hypothetical protein